jgi:hypothetical protein
MSPIWREADIGGGAASAEGLLLTQSGHSQSLQFLRPISGNPPALSRHILGKATAMEDLCGAEAIGKPFNFEAATNKIRDAIKEKSPPAT